MPPETANINMLMSAHPTPHTSAGRHAGILRHLRPALQSHHKRGAFTQTFTVTAELKQELGLLLVPIRYDKHDFHHILLLYGPPAALAKVHVS